MSKDELEGRVRAIEAILLELPEVTPDVIEAAKTRIRDPKYHPHPDVAEGMLKMSGHLDQHAEKALLKLVSSRKDTRGARAQTSGCIAAGHSVAGSTPGSSGYARRRDGS